MQTACILLRIISFLQRKQVWNQQKQWIPNGQKGHVYIASSDVYKEGLAAIEAGYVDSDSLMNIVGMCQTIVDYSVKLANGEKCPEVFIKGPVFDKANYKDADLQKLLW